MELAALKKKYRLGLLFAEILLALFQIAFSFGYGLGGKVLNLPAKLVPIPTYLSVVFFLGVQVLYSLKAEDFSLTPLFHEITKKKLEISFYVTLGSSLLAAALLLLCSNEVLIPNTDKAHLLIGLLFTIPGLSCYLLFQTLPYFQGEGELASIGLFSLLYEAFLVLAPVGGMIAMICLESSGASLLGVAIPLCLIIALGLDPKGDKENPADE